MVDLSSWEDKNQGCRFSEFSARALLVELEDGVHREQQ